MLYREIIAVCSEIRTEQINILCGQNVEFLDSKPAGTQETCWHTVNLLAHSKHYAIQYQFASSLH